MLGVSGGADSLAMLHLFAGVREAMGLAVQVVHVHHGIRGDDADADAAFVQHTAQAWGLPVRVIHADVPTLVQERKLSIEEAARQVRYTALGEVAVEVGASAVAVAHNADDQAETVLMHLIRGSGLAGLRGMQSLTPLSDYHLLQPIDADVRLIRPMLGVPREAIEAYCVDHDLEPRFDRSNLDTTYFRNRLRHDLLPLLRDLNPNIRQTLNRTADVITAEYKVLESAVDEAWDAVANESYGALYFSRKAWRALPLALQRATIRRAVWSLRESLRDVSYVQVNDAVKVAATGETGSQATLPGGVMLSVGYEAIHIGLPAKAPILPDWPLLSTDEEIKIGVDEGITLLDGGWQFALQHYDGPHEGDRWHALLSERWVALLNRDALTEPLMLRPRQPGNRFQPQGVGGTQTVADFMINEKIPAAWRDRIPLLVTGDQIVWVAGWRVDERFVVTSGTDEVWLARFAPIAP